jgi:hypothetical protein
MATGALSPVRFKMPFTRSKSFPAPRRNRPSHAESAFHDSG